MLSKIMAPFAENVIRYHMTWAIFRDMTAPNQRPMPVVKTNRLQALKPGLVGGGLGGRERGG